MKTIIIALALLTSGCAVIVPGVSVGFFGTHYVHAEFTKGEKVWETHLFRPWGTSRANTYVDQVSERLGIEGDGISINMARLAAVLGDKALCAVPAIAPSCVFRNGIGRFQGTDDDRVEALEAALE